MARKVATGSASTSARIAATASGWRTTARRVS